MVDLYERTMRSDQPATPPGLANYFGRTLDHPWVDPEIPSLVYEATDGRILGFIGSHVRRARLDDRPIRLGCSGQLVSDPRERRLAIGARLLRTYLAGPQDLTITDGATPLVHEMWTRLGGHALYPGSVVWTRLLRPSRAIGDRLLARAGRGRWESVARPMFSLLDAATRRLTRPPEADAGGRVSSDELTATALVAHQVEVSPEARLRIDYDLAFAEWLFRELAAVQTRGRLARRLLRRDGRIIGWYVAYLNPGGIAQVMDVSATRGSLDAVLDRLFADAWQSGSAALEGRLEPALFEPLARRRCLIRAGERALFHSREREISATISLGGSALSRLAGEWWMGHHTEPFAVSRESRRTRAGSARRAAARIRLAKR